MLIPIMRKVMNEVNKKFTDFGHTETHYSYATFITYMISLNIFDN